MISGIETKHILETRPLVSWGAIFAGWLLGTAVMILLMNLGAAMGVSMIDPANPDSVNRGLAVGTVVWVLFSWVVAFFISGLAAAWLAGHIDRAVGAMHGMSVWALALAATVILGALGVTGLAKAGQTVGQGLLGLGAAASQSPQAAEQSSGLAAAIKDQISQAAASTAPAGSVDAGQARQAIDQLDARTLTGIAGNLVKGNDDQARNELAMNTSLTRQQVDDVLRGLQQKTEQAKAQIAEAAKKAADYSAGALWLTFFSGVFGFAAAAFGGSFGAHRLIRSYSRFDRV